MKAERKAKSALKEKCESRLFRKNQRINQVQVRLLNISKEFENTITKEMERQNENMSNTMMKQFMIEKEKRELMRQKEEEY